MNVDVRIDDTAMRAALGLIGHILSCRVAADHDGGPLGSGVAHYRNDDDARLAVAKLDAMRIGAKELAVSLMPPAPVKEQEGGEHGEAYREQEAPLRATGGGHESDCPQGCAPARARSQAEVARAAEAPAPSAAEAPPEVAAAAATEEGRARPQRCYSFRFRCVFRFELPVLLHLSAKTKNETKPETLQNSV